MLDRLVLIITYLKDRVVLMHCTILFPSMLQLLFCEVFFLGFTSGGNSLLRVGLRSGGDEFRLDDGDTVTGW